jgi:hypothetical protein
MKRVFIGKNNGEAEKPQEFRGGRWGLESLPRKRGWAGWEPSSIPSRFLGGGYSVSTKILIVVRGSAVRSARAGAPEVSRRFSSTRTEANIAHRTRVMAAMVRQESRRIVFASIGLPPVSGLSGFGGDRIPESDPSSTSSTEEKKSP